MSASDKPVLDGELKPCPFCGRSGAAQGASRNFISVWCACGARGPDEPFPPDYIDPHIPIRKCREAWNTRAPLPVLKQVEEALDNAPSMSSESGVVTIAFNDDAQADAFLAAISSIREHLK